MYMNTLYRNTNINNEKLEENLYKILPRAYDNQRFFEIIKNIVLFMTL